MDQHMYRLKTTFENNHRLEEIAEVIKDEGALMIEDGNGKHLAAVYTPGLGLFLTSKKIDVYFSENVSRSKGECIIDGTKFAQSYTNGFLDGRALFQERYKPENEDFEQPKIYKKLIHDAFFHSPWTSEFGTKRTGIYWVKYTYPKSNITPQVINEYGTFAGMVYELEFYKDRYPRLFEGFDKCENFEPEHSNDQINTKLSHPQIALLYFYEGLPITENNGPEISVKYGYKAGRSLYNTFKEKEKLTNRINGGNAVKDLQIILPLLSPEAKALAESELILARGAEN